MKIIGLTGSIAMGKSEVATIFRNQGFPVFDADKEVHQLYDSPEGVALIQPLVPEVIVKNRIDRTILAEKALADTLLLSRVEKSVHAEIARRRETFISKAKTQSAALVVLDVPLLFETGSDKTCDATIVVSASAEQQKLRALARPGMTEQRLNRILSRQMPDGEKRQRATFILENNGTLEQLKHRTLALIDQLV
jgi:dephospho-CoA kinase